MRHCGLVDVTKRDLIAATDRNIGRILLNLFGIGKPRSMQGGRELASRLDLLLAQFLTSLSTIHPLQQFANQNYRSGLLPVDALSRAIFRLS